MQRFRYEPFKKTQHDCHQIWPVSLALSRPSSAFYWYRSCSRLSQYHKPECLGGCSRCWDLQGLEVGASRESVVSELRYRSLEEVLEAAEGCMVLASAVALQAAKEVVVWLRGLAPFLALVVPQELPFYANGLRQADLTKTCCLCEFDADVLGVWLPVPQLLLLRSSA